MGGEKKQFETGSWTWWSWIRAS